MESKKAKIKIILKNEKEQKRWADCLSWTATEYPPKNDDHYGNGYYIGVERINDGYYTRIDCRYIEYDFYKIIIDFINDFYNADRIKSINITEAE